MSTLGLLALILLWQAMQMTLFLPMKKSAWRLLLEQHDGTLYRVGLVFLGLSLLVAFCAALEVS